MHTRIDLYAVDVPAFAAHIDQSIGATLWAYAENGSDRAISIDWNDETSNRGSETSKIAFVPIRVGERLS